MGVQWNLIVHPEQDIVELGVNLEGSEKMGGMQIADFLLARPSIAALQRNCTNLADIYVKIFRDAWQVSSRPAIEEQYVGGRQFVLEELNETKWQVIMDEALLCLDAEQGYRKRKRGQWVTLESSGSRVQRDISPHLQITTPINIDAEPYDSLKGAAEIMEPARRWVLDAIYRHH